MEKWFRITQKMSMANGILLLKKPMTLWKTPGFKTYTCNF